PPREVEVRMIENVVDIAAKLGLKPLTQLDLPLKGSVQACQARPDHDIPACGSEAVLSGKREGLHVEPLRGRFGPVVRIVDQIGALQIVSVDEANMRHL